LASAFTIIPPFLKTGPQSRALQLLCVATSGGNDAGGGCFVEDELASVGHARVLLPAPGALQAVRPGELRPKSAVPLGRVREDLAADS